MKFHRPFGQPIHFLDPVFLIGGAIACVALFGYFSIRIDLPVRIHGDHMFMLVQIKKMINGSGWRWEPHLGFPGIQDQMLFPLFDFSQRLISQILSYFTQNLFLIVNLTYIIGISLIFWCSYYALRHIEIKPWIALVGGISFTVSLFFASRSYHHDYLALCYSVPLGGLLSLRLARQNTSASVVKLLFDKRTLLVLLIVATSGLYYAFFTCMFLILVALAKGLSERKFYPVTFAFAFSMILLTLVLLFGYGTAIIELAQGRLATALREPVEQIRYALFLGAGLHVFADAHLWTESFTHYNSIMATIMGSQLLEWPGIVITTVILASPVLAFALCAMPRQQTHSASSLNMIALCAMLITFGIIFAASGGLGFIFNFVISPVIRAQARILPFLSFFSVIIIVITMQYVSELKQFALRSTINILITAALIASIAPVFGSIASKQKEYLSSPYYVNVQNISSMLASKDTAGLQTILQLPYATWPEAADIKDFPLYNHQMPYLLDIPGSKTRWSYGLTQNQPEFQHVTKLLDPEHMPVDLVDRAKTLGFDSILLEKAAYSLEDIASIERILALNSGACRLYEDAARVLFSLRNFQTCEPK